MNLREALIQQQPSLALQRAAQAEIARLDAEVLWLKEYADTVRLRADAATQQYEFLLSFITENKALETKSTTLAIDATLANR